MYVPSEKCPILEECGAKNSSPIPNEAFLTDRKIQLIIDGHENKEREV